MSDNLLDSYFVELKAIPDSQSWLKFAVVLKEATHAIDGFSLNTLKNVVGIEVAAVGAFAAMGVSMIGLADKAAMTDQSYRLMGMRMLMTKESSRAMQIALDELGATIDEVAYDPELNKRFQFLYEQNIKLGRAMGANYDDNMRSIRDLRVEYSRFSAEFEFLIGGVVSSLFDKLGIKQSDVLSKLDNLNQWFSANLSDISGDISDYLIEPWNLFKAIVTDAGQDLKLFAGDFTFLSGLLLNDSSLQTTEFSIKNIVKSFEEWIERIATAVEEISLLGKVTSHVAVGLGAEVGSVYQGLKGNLKESYRLDMLSHSEMGAAGKDVYDFGNALLGAPQGMNSNPDMAGFKGITGAMSEGIESNYGPGMTGKAETSAIIEKMAKKYNVNADLISALINQESGGHPGVISSKNAKGMMQLMDSTASQYGVKDSFNVSQNIEGGTHYLSDLLKRYHYDVPRALAAYNAGPGNVDKYGGVPPFAETQRYVERIIGDFSKRAATHSSSVSIGQVIVNVPHNIPSDQMHEFINRSMKDITTKAIRNTTAQTAGGAYF